METYSEQYNLIKKQEEEFIDVMFKDIVSMFKNTWLAPKVIGNMVYYYCEENGKSVPAYCYLFDYNNGNKVFKPIYDKENNQEYGWSNIEDVIRILDYIRKVFYEERFNKK
jgi:hypothetical protein